MGRRGPPAKPTALKLVAGNPGKRPLPAGEPVPPAGVPDAPEYLDDRSRRVWDQLVPRLAGIGLARSIDGAALGRYCVLFVMWSEAVAWCRQHGSTYPVRAEDRDGKPGRVLIIREFPQAKQVRALHRDLMIVEREFGLTPAARTRIQLEAESGAKGDVNDLKRRFFAGPA